jgi:hypothetical protein
MPDAIIHSGPTLAIGVAVYARLCRRSSDRPGGDSLSQVQTHPAEAERRTPVLGSAWSNCRRFQRP